MSSWKKVLALALLSSSIASADTIKKYPNYLEPLFSSINQTNIRLDRRMSRLPPGNSWDYDPLYDTKEVHFASSWPHQLTAKTTLALTCDQFEEREEQIRQDNYLPESYFNIYFAGTLGFGDVYTRKDQTGFNYWTAGGLTGFDYFRSKGGFGLLLDYDRIEGHCSRHWGKFDIDEAHASLYMTYAPSHWAFKGIVGGGYEWYTIRRHIHDHHSAKGAPHGAEFDGFFGIEYAFENSQQNFQFVPIASAQYIHLNVEKYHEYNAGLSDTRVGSQIAKSLRSTLGARINGTIEGDRVVFTPEVLLAWQREYFDKTRHVHVKPRDFIGPKRSLKMGQPGRDIGLAGIDLLLTIDDTYGIEASYDFEWNHMYHDHNIYLCFNFTL